MSLQRTLPVLLAASALVLTPACRRHKAEAPAAEPFTVDKGRITVPEGSPLRSRLKVQAAESALLQVRFTAPGQVEADPADLVKLAAPLAGRIVKIHVKQGESVRQGQPLITLESPDFAQAQADHAKARAQVQQARKALERVKELHQHEVASRKELEQAETEAVNAESEWRRSEARLAQLGVKAGDVSGGQLVMRSPLSGKVCELAAAHGGYWNDLNAPLMVLANLDRVYLVANVQENDIPRLYVGQEATATLASLPGEALRCRVASTGELLDPETRTAKVRLPLENKGHRLLPAMFATVSFQQRAHTGVRVPTGAVLQDTEGAKVLVEVAPWTFEERRVKVGAQMPEGTEILDGLKAGDRIVAQEGVLLHAH